MVEKVRAKLKLTSITSHYWNPKAKTLKFEAVYDSGIPEDQRFYDATPTGQVEILVNNSVALEFFSKLGESFYVDFTKTDEMPQ